MYTGQARPVLPRVVAEAEKAEGFVQLCRQQSLIFGSDRRVPVQTRPVTPLKRDGTRMVVLPCTTRGNPESPDFFELTSRVMWTRTISESRSFAFWRYEVVMDDSLGSKIGVMTQSGRIELLTWVKSRY
jgi:hypothetical protein